MVYEEQGAFTLIELLIVMAIVHGCALAKILYVRPGVLFSQEPPE